MPYPATPQFRGQIADLVTRDHTRLEGEPLLLAIYYASALAPHDECLFEVFSGFGYDEVSPEKEIFQVQFGPTQGFPLPEGSHLRLVLTNPAEFEAAVRQNWAEVRDLQDALHQGQGAIIYQDERDSRAARILDLLQVELIAA